MSSFKTCTKCGATKPLDDFYALKGMRDGHRNDCKSCNLAEKAALHRANPGPARRRATRWQQDNRDRYLARLKRWREEDPGKKKRMDRESHLKRKYGITQADYDRMLEAQGFGCGICGDVRPGGRTFHVDHDHATGAVRGLLCVKCNQGLGLLRENPALLAMAIEYLGAAGSPILVERMEMTRRARDRAASLRTGAPL